MQGHHQGVGPAGLEGPGPQHPHGVQGAGRHAQHLALDLRAGGFPGRGLQAGEGVLEGRGPPYPIEIGILRGMVKVAEAVLPGGLQEPGRLLRVPRSPWAQARL